MQQMNGQNSSKLQIEVTNQRKMIIESLQITRFALLEDSLDVNMLPLLLDAVMRVSSNVNVAIMCYEQPAATWKNILPRFDIQCYDNNHLSILGNISSKTAVVIDSFNQMALQVGMQKSFEVLRSLLLNPLVIKIIALFHTDCIHGSKSLTQLEHLAHMTLTSEFSSDEFKMRITMHNKKGGKLIKTTEDIWYDSEHKCLRSASVSNKQLKQEGKEEVLPHMLTTFKIGLEEKEKQARDNLELPYLKKSETGRVYYDHDEADDWDDEDPDEDLNI